MEIEPTLIIFTQIFHTTKKSILFSIVLYCYFQDRLPNVSTEALKWLSAHPSNHTPDRKPLLNQICDITETVYDLL